MKSIVLLSGGLDSAVNLKVAARETQIIKALTFDYGQRSGWREVKAAEAMCHKMGIPHEIVRLDWLADITPTALVDVDKPLPKLEPEELDDPKLTQEAARMVWVPNRNGVLLNIAASYGEALEADVVVTGFNKEEASSFPDNSVQFLEAVNQSLSYSTLSRITVRSYTAEMDKSQIVSLGREIDAPIDLAWSCYEGGEEHCWMCESCLRFKRALEQTKNWDWYQGLATSAA